MRLRIRGWPKLVKVGYGTPRVTRHLRASGLREIIIHNVRELERVDPKQEVARIAHTVGERKRVHILESAAKMEILVVNPGPSEREELEVPTEPEALETAEEKPVEGKKQ